MTANQPVYGVLTTTTVELPPKTPEQAAYFEKENRAAGGLYRIFRGATDWAYVPAQAHKPVKLEKGDLVKIFKTVTDGDVQWQGTVDFDTSEYQHGWQRGLSKQDWNRMFSANLAVKLEKDGKVIFGALEPFSETGTEGVIWSVSAYGDGHFYDRLHWLKNGDRLTVYSMVRDGDVEWQGTLDFDPETVSKPGWLEILRTAKHMDTEKWMSLCFQNRPVVVTPAI